MAGGDGIERDGGGDRLGWEGSALEECEKDKKDVRRGLKWSCVRIGGTLAPNFFSQQDDSMLLGTSLGQQKGLGTTKREEYFQKSLWKTHHIDLLFKLVVLLMSTAVLLFILDF